MKRAVMGVVLSLVLGACSAAPALSTPEGPIASLDRAPTPAPTPVAGTIVGFGAMNANWEATHRADPGAAPGAGYDRDPALGVGVDRYFGVLHDNGIVDGYTERLPKGVSIGEALQAALDEVPAGTKVLWFVTKPTCAQEELRSSILASSGIDGVFVEFATATAAGDQGYSPKNANEVIFKLGSYPKVADAPGC